MRGTFLYFYLFIRIFRIYSVYLYVLFRYRGDTHTHTHILGPKYTLCNIFYKYQICILNNSNTQPNPKDWFPDKTEQIYCFSLVIPFNIFKYMGGIVPILPIEHLVYSNRTSISNHTYTYLCMYARVHLRFYVHMLYI